MIPYWLLFSYFAAGALLSPATARMDRSRPYPVQAEFRSRLGGYPMLVLGAVLIALMIGFRYEVGGDWGSYKDYFSYARYVDLQTALGISDPGYQLLNWIVGQIGGDLWLVNLACGLIFSWGFLKFAQAQPNPWIAALVGIPYLVIVVAMGYSRQSVAIGILMAGLVAFGRRGSILQFAAYVAAAALFHRTAIIAFPLVAIAVRRNRFVNIAITLVLAFFLYDIFLAEDLPRFVRGYIEAEYSSQGALIRIAMSVIPAIVFLAYKDRLGFSENDRQVWLNFSLSALVLLALFFASPSSTAVDRIALYIIPLQLAVLSRVPGTVVSMQMGAFLIVLYSLAVQFVWLNFAAHAEAWVPYQFYPLE